jgi:hypothetical protein
MPNKKTHHYISAHEWIAKVLLILTLFFEGAIVFIAVKHNGDPEDWKKWWVIGVLAAVMVHQYFIVQNFKLMDLVFGTSQDNRKAVLQAEGIDKPQIDSLLDVGITPSYNKPWARIMRFIIHVGLAAISGEIIMLLITGCISYDHIAVEEGWQPIGAKYLLMDLNTFSGVYLMCSVILGALLWLWNVFIIAADYGARLRDLFSGVFQLVYVVLKKDKDEVRHDEYKDCQIAVYCISDTLALCLWLGFYGIYSNSFAIEGYWIIAALGLLYFCFILFRFIRKWRFGLEFY